MLLTIKCAGRTRHGQWCNSTTVNIPRTICIGMAFTHQHPRDTQSIPVQRTIEHLVNFIPNAVSGSGNDHLDGVLPAHKSRQVLVGEAEHVFGSTCEERGNHRPGVYQFEFFVGVDFFRRSLLGGFICLRNISSFVPVWWAGEAQNLID